MIPALSLLLTISHALPATLSHGIVSCIFASGWENCECAWNEALHGGRGFELNLQAVLGQSDPNYCKASHAESLDSAMDWRWIGYGLTAAGTETAA